MPSCTRAMKSNLFYRKSIRRWSIPTTPNPHSPSASPAANTAAQQFQSYRGDLSRGHVPGKKFNVANREDRVNGVAELPGHHGLLQQRPVTELFGSAARSVTADEEKWQTPPVDD